MIMVEHSAKVGNRLGHAATVPVFGNPERKTPMNNVSRCEPKWRQAAGASTHSRAETRPPGLRWTGRVRALRKTGLAATLAVAIAGCSHPTEKQFLSKFESRPAPSFKLNDLNDKPVTLAQFRGKLVVLAFFAYG